MNSFIRFFLLLAFAERLCAAQQTIKTGTNPNDGAGDSLRTAFTKVNANFADLYNTAVFSNSIVQWSTITNTPATLAGYGITNGITAATASSTYAPLSGPVFTNSLTLPVWSTANRPASPTAGMIGWNTDLARFDHYVGTNGWKDFVRLDGDTMTGLLVLSADPSAALGAATKQYVDVKAPLASPTFTGTVTIPSGASISGYLTSATAASTYAPLASPALTGTPTVPTAAVDTSTTQAASTAFVLGQAASATPLIDGTAAVGTSTRYARGDHVHPTDTTRAPLASPTFTGTVTIPSGASISGYLTTATAASTYAPLASPTFTGAVGVTGGTITGSSTPVWNATQTWNNGATTFTGSLLNVTDTASAAASLIQDWQVGGASKASISKAGLFTCTGQTFVGNNPTFTVSGTLLLNQDFSLGARAGGLFIVNSSGAYTWSGSTAYTVTPDTYLYRDAAYTLAQRNGVNAQGFRVYNTFTDASNYERATVDFTTSANVLTIGSAKAGTGSSRAVNFIVGGVTALTLGTAGDVQLPKTITAAGTTGAQTINTASGSVNLAAAATSLVVTDSLVSTSSVIICTVGSNDTTCKSVQAVAASGSFTIYANAAPTAETRVNFIITN